MANSDNTDVLNTLSTQMADAVERISPALVLVNGRARQAASGRRAHQICRVEMCP